MTDRGQQALILIQADGKQIHALHASTKDQAEMLRAFKFYLPQFSIP